MDDIMKLAERFDDWGEQQARRAFSGYDNMKHGSKEIARLTAEAANCFAVAAALRERAAS